ncbi:MAG: hypothetical protein R3B09_05430 [Nannocystaceae bacterium]
MPRLRARRRLVPLVALASIACNLGPGSSGSDDATATATSSSTTDAMSSTSTESDGSTTSTTSAETTASETTGTPEPQGPPPGAGKNPYPWSSESWDAVCKDNQDNDGNSYIDCDDFTCSRNPAVIACGAQAIYESSPTLCGNGKDDDGDGKVDCADPDCVKNPFLNVCVYPEVEDGCGQGIDGDGDGFKDCDDRDCLALDDACPISPGSLRILFDQTLDETAAGGPNSDWIVDPWGRLPQPSNPLSRNEWKGALSSFAFALYQQGHRIESLVPWDGALSFGDPQNPQDLDRYDVLVLVEPSRQLSGAEKATILDYVAGGGGLLMIANHISADRDGNGWSAAAVYNDLFDDNPVEADPFGLRFDEVDVDILTPLTRVEAPAHPVIAGPNGTVERIGLYLGSTAHFTGKSPGGQGLIVTDDAPDADHGVIIGATTYGAGRVVFATDSAQLGDGTDSHGTTQGDHDAFNDPALDHAILYLNAIAWLGGA